VNTTTTLLTKEQAWKKVRDGFAAYAEDDTMEPADMFSSGICWAIYSLCYKTKEIHLETYRDMCRDMDVDTLRLDNAGEDGFWWPAEQKYAQNRADWINNLLANI
jgi:hypothetical protein